MKTINTHFCAIILLGLMNLHCLAQSAALQTPTAGTYGELRQWHRVSIAFEGPNTSETATPNPFTDFRLDVTFTHPSGRSITVPGYYAADGKAGETSSGAGKIWRVHFTPPLTGVWTYTASFKQGTNVAIGTGGSNNSTINGTTGSLTIAATNKTGRDFRGHGRLEYVSKHHLKFATSGRYFMKYGADSPENFLAYADVDNTPSAGSPGDNSGVRHTWAPHVQDWGSGDPQWKANKGRGAIGAINYLADQGASSVSMLIYSTDGGDDGRVFPWVTQTDKRRFDCSKLDQWEIMFQHMNDSGLNITIKLAEEENYAQFNGPNRPDLLLYYREIVARFGHHLALTWVISEEYGGPVTTGGKVQELRERGDLLAGIDPWDNNVTTHTRPQSYDYYNTYYGGTYGRDAFTGASMQIKDADTSAEEVFNATLKIVSESAAAGRPWVVANDEQGHASEGVLDQSAGDRKFTIWGQLMAGGAGTEFYVNKSGINYDSAFENYREISTMWKWARHCVNDFVYANDIPFWTMSNEDSLISNKSLNHCLAQPGNVYVIYQANGGSNSLNLGGQTGNYDVKWFDPRNGGTLQNGSVTSISGGGIRSIGNAPNTPSADWAVLVRKTVANGGNAGSPFGGSARAIPGLIEAEAFNDGANGVAYSDSDAGSRNPDPNFTFRSNTDVDLGKASATSGEAHIGWIDDFEFWNYAVNVTGGTYDIEVRAASGDPTPGALQITLDTTSLGTLPITSTGSYVAFQTFKLTNVNVSGGAGKNLRLTAVNGGKFNFDSIRFTPSATGATGTPFLGSARAIPGLIEAEEFNDGANGQAYSDTDEGTNNQNPPNFRIGSDVDLGKTSETQGQAHIGWIASGEFWNYAVNVTGGTYDIEVRAASGNTSPGDLLITLDEVNLGTVPIESTGNFGTFQTFNLPNVNISGGAGKNLRLTAVNGGVFNLDWIRFTPASTGGGSPQTVNTTPSDDAFLQNGSVQGGSLLRIQASGPTRETFLKFNVTGVNGTVSSSKLQLTVAGDAGSGTIRVFRGETNSWTENNLSSANAPGRGALLATKSGTFAIGSLVELNLGNSISGNGTVSLIVVLDAGGNDVSFSSKEGSDAAKLSITSQ